MAREESDYLASLAAGEPFEMLRESVEAYIRKSLKTGIRSPSEALHTLADLYNDKYPQAPIGVATIYSWWTGRRTKPDFTFGVRTIDLLRTL